MGGPNMLIVLCLSFCFLFFCADFCTPKPDIGYSTENNMVRNQENSLLLTDSDSKDAPSTINEVQVGLNNMAVVKSILPGIDIVIVYSTVWCLSILYCANTAIWFCIIGLDLMGTKMVARSLPITVLVQHAKIPEEKITYNSTSLHYLQVPFSVFTSILNLWNISYRQGANSTSGAFIYQDQKKNCTQEHCTNK